MLKNCSILTKLHVKKLNLVLTLAETELSIPLSHEDSEEFVRKFRKT